MLLNWIVAILFFLPIDVKAMSCLKQSECQCEIGVHGGILVNCNGRSLTKIPSFELNDISTQIYEISLKDNNIKEISAFSFNGTILKKLDFTNNPLSFISDMAFHGVEESLRELLLGSTRNRSLRITSIPLQAMVNLESLTISNFNDMNIKETTFLNLKNLRELSLTEGYLESISSSAFQDQSETLEKLDLSENKFKTMPLDALSGLINLKTLSLSSNNIKSFSENAFQSFKNLKVLNIDRLNNPEIEKKAFHGLTGSLEVLNMASSSFTDLVLEEIKDMSNLIYLHARYNEFTTLDKFLDGTFSRLKLLDLQDNSISVINRLESETLEILILENNPISEVSVDAFHQMPSLVSLNLNSARGLKLHENTFSSQTTSLKELRINHVNLSATHFKVLANLKSLEILGASGCDFSKIPDFMFYSLGKLKTLILNENNISSLNQRSLYGLGSSLQHLSLTGNKLETLNECVFYNFDKIDVTKLKLDGNPLICDCRMNWLYNRIKVIRIRPETSHLVQLLQWKCENFDIKFHLLSDIDFNDCATYPPPQCEQFLEFSTTEKPEVDTPELFVTDIKSTSFVIHWKDTFSKNAIYVLSYEHDGKQLDLTIKPTDGIPNYHVIGLQQSSTYKISLTIFSNSINQTIHTKATTLSWIEEHKKQVIIGVSVAFILFVLALFLISFVFCITRRRPNVPVIEITEQSKRYVKNTDYTKVNIRKHVTSSYQTPSHSDAIIKSTLNNMSEQEKYRLVNLLTNSRNSLDALEDEFLPKKLQVRHIYEEIDNDVYDEINLDKIT